MLFLIAIANLCWNVSAYTPEYATIATHAAEKHGKGAYQIEQEVTYRKESETYTVKETWQVTGENELRVTLEGRGPLKGLVTGTIVYQGGTRSASENAQAVRARNLGEDWLEPLFHFRSSRYLRSKLVGLRITSQETLRDRAPLNFEGPPEWQPQGFVRLSRTGGAVTWAIGATPPAAATPMIWIEQDQFVLRKLKTASQVILKADDYAKYDDGMWYPRSRTYTFGPHTVQVQTLQVKPLGKLAANDSRFKPTSLTPAKDAVRLPEVEGLREFYSRFR